MPPTGSLSESAQIPSDRDAAIDSLLESKPARAYPLSALQAALRELLIGFGVAIALLSICVLVVRWREMPPRPKLTAKADVQSVYREQREEANEDAQSDFERIGSAFLVPTFTALLGYFVGHKREESDAAK